MIEKLEKNNIDAKLFIMFLTGNMLKKVNNAKVTEDDV